MKKKCCTKTKHIQNFQSVKALPVLFFGAEILKLEVVCAPVLSPPVDRDDAVALMCSKRGSLSPWSAKNPDPSRDLLVPWP